jgi:FMN-dependent NADH-azoreductase
MKLLHVDSSILGQNSASRELSAAIVARWQEAVPGLQITYRDLDAAPLPHLSCASLTQGNVTETADAGRALQDFLDADVIDHLAVAGKTFHYTETGPKGLLAGKQVIVASSRGGFHKDSASDFQEDYLRHIFGFFGISDVEVVRAEGLAVSPQHRTDGLAAAHASIRTPLAAAA